MEIRKKYSISTWTKWNATFSDAIDEFFALYTYYPNILQSNRHTFSQIDFLVNEMPNEKHRVLRKDFLSNKQIEPMEGEFIALVSFENSKCTVDFAIDNNLEDRAFVLIYDSDPDWDNDDTIITDDPFVESKKLVRA